MAPLFSFLEGLLDGFLELVLGWGLASSLVCFSFLGSGSTCAGSNEHRRNPRRHPRAGPLMKAGPRLQTKRTFVWAPWRFSGRLLGGDLGPLWLLLRAAVHRRLKLHILTRFDGF